MTIRLTKERFWAIIVALIAALLLLWWFVDQWTDKFGDDVVQVVAAVAV